MRRILTSLVLVASAYSFAQVGISGKTSDTPRATLDVRAIGGTTPDGILIPKVDKGRAQSMPTPEDSTLAYIENKGTGGNKTADVDADGFYYFKGDKWIKLGGGATAVANTGIVTMTHFSSDYILKPTDTTLVCDSGANVKLIIPDSEYVEGRNFILLNNDCSGALQIVNEHNLEKNIFDYYGVKGSDNRSLQEGIGQHLYYDGNKWFNTTGY